jgi:hypothetical protein
LSAESSPTSSAEVQQSLTRTPEQVQNAHLNFVNAVLPNLSGR